LKGESRAKREEKSGDHFRKEGRLVELGYPARGGDVPQVARFNRSRKSTEKGLRERSISCAIAFYNSGEKSSEEKPSRKREGGEKRGGGEEWICRKENRRRSPNHITGT